MWRMQEFSSIVVDGVIRARDSARRGNVFVDRWKARLGLSSAGPCTPPLFILETLTYATTLIISNHYFGNNEATDD